MQRKRGNTDMVKFLESFTFLRWIKYLLSSFMKCVEIDDIYVQKQSSHFYLLSPFSINLLKSPHTWFGLCLLVRVAHDDPQPSFPSPNALCPLWLHRPHKAASLISLSSTCTPNVDHALWNSRTTVNVFSQFVGGLIFVLSEIPRYWYLEDFSNRDDFFFIHSNANSRPFLF